MYDAISVIGMALALVSIWLALYLAKNQLRADFKKAADGAVDRIAQMSLSNDLGDSVRYFRDTHKALDEKDWDHASIRIGDAASILARLSKHKKLLPLEQSTLDEVIADIRLWHDEILAHSRSPGNRGHLSRTVMNNVGVTIVKIEKIRGRLLGHN